MRGPAIRSAGLLACQAERSSAVSGIENAGENACATNLDQQVTEQGGAGIQPARPQKAHGQRCGRAALGSVGQEAHLTLRRLLLFFLFASPLAAQFELQVVEPAGARVAPSIYDLGSGTVNSTLTASFRLLNITATSATVTVITAGGVGFSLAAPTLPVAVDAQFGLDFTVTFHSSNLGSYSAVLRAENITILLTAAVVPSLTYRVEGTPLSALVDFGSAVRGSPVRRRFTVLNETPVLLTVPAISISGIDFAFSDTPPSGTILSPQQSVTFAVDFIPSAAGSRLAILTLGDRTVFLTGIALDPPLPRPSISVDLKQPASAQQGDLIINFDQPTATAGTGAAVLDFRGSADPTVAFASGGRTVTFPVAVGDTHVTLPFQTGTTAGTIVFSVRLGDATDAVSVTIPGAAAVLTQVQATRSVGSLVVQVTGWDNTHSVSQLDFTFFDAAGNAIAPGAVRVDSTADFARYFAGTDVGGSFTLRAVFPVTGNAAQVASFEMSVGDSIGTAKSARTPIQ